MTKRLVSTRTRDVVGYALAFALPVLVFIAACAIRGIYPLGDTTFLSEDLRYQYVDYFAWFRRVLLGQDAAAYSSSLSLGTNTWGMLSYYLSSPLNLLIVLFDADHLTLFVWVISAIKLGLMGLTVSFFMRRRFELAWPVTLMLSLSWVWCGWTQVMLRNIMWIDGMVLLPLMLWAVHELVHHGRWRLLLACFVAAVVTCWYMAYMTMLASALYAILEVVIAPEEGLALHTRQVARRVGQFCATAFGALALSAWTFLPTVVSMLRGASQRDDGFLGIFTSGSLGTCHVEAPLVGLFQTSQAPTVHIPQLFCGTVALVLACLFFCDKAIARRTRVALLVAGAFAGLSIVFNPLYVAWCGFVVPSGFYSRISWLASVVVLWCAARELRSLANGSRPSTRALIVTGSLLAVVPVCLLVSSAVSSPYVVIASVVAEAAVLAYVVGQGRPWCRIAAGCTMLAVVAQVLVVLVVAWEGVYLPNSQQAEVNYVTTSRTQLEELEASDDGFYRIDKTYTRAMLTALNESLAVGYRSISSYCSSYDANAARLLGRLGYTVSEELTAYTTTGCQVSDSLLGLAYVSTLSCPAGYVDAGLTSTPSGQTFYRNPYALPLGYGVSAQATSTKLTDKTNVFVNQNDLAKGLSGVDQDCYVPLDATLVSSGDGTATWQVEVPAGVTASVYVPLKKSFRRAPIQGVNMKVDDGATACVAWRIGHTIQQVAPASEQATTHTVTLTWDPAMSKITEAPTPLFYALDETALANVSQTLAVHPFEVSAFDDGHIAGTYEATADTPYLLLTVPFSPGWTVRVNGEVVSTTSVLDNAFMAIPVSEGHNDITLDFAVPSLDTGIGISAVAVLGLVAVLLVSRRRARRALSAPDTSDGGRSVGSHE